MADYNYKRKGRKSPSSMIELVLISVVLSIFLAMSWRFSFNNVCIKKPLGMGSNMTMAWALFKALMPLLLVIILHCLASPEVSKYKSEILRDNVDNNNNSSSDKTCYSFKKESLMPWALASLIVLLLFMANYQKKSWFLR